MPNTHTTLTSLFSDIADAIRNKTGSSADIVADNFPTEIDAIPTGVTPAEFNDVNFYDYDGTILYSYTAAEALALTELPANPSHTGLTAQGWNWSLTEMQTQVRSCGMCDVGQMYVTDDGKTRLYIKIEYPEDLEVHVTWYQSVANGVVIDWGDGSATETFAGTTIADGTCVHTYAALGEYMITMTPASSSVQIRLGNNEVSCGLMGSFVSDSTSATYGHTTSQKVLRKVECGANVYRLNNYALTMCTNLQTVTIPNTLDRLNNSSVFWICTNLVGIVVPRNPSITAAASATLPSQYAAYASSLKFISISPTVQATAGYTTTYASNLKRLIYPYTCTGMSASSTQVALFYEMRSVRQIILDNWVGIGPGTNLCNECRSLVELNIPEDAAMTVSSNTQFGTAFQYCMSLRKVWLPSATQYISVNAFRCCGSMEELHVRATTPPTITSTTFSTMSTDCKIYVPSSRAPIFDLATLTLGAAVRSQLVSGTNEIYFEVLDGAVSITINGTTTAGIDPSTYGLTFSSAQNYDRVYIDIEYDGSAITSYSTPVGVNATILNAYASATNWTTYASQLRIEGT